MYVIKNGDHYAFRCHRSRADSDFTWGHTSHQNAGARFTTADEARAFVSGPHDRVVRLVKKKRTRAERVTG